MRKKETSWIWGSRKKKVLSEFEKKVYWYFSTLMRRYVVGLQVFLPLIQLKKRGTGNKVENHSVRKYVDKFIDNQTKLVIVFFKWSL